MGLSVLLPESAKSWLRRIFFLHIKSDGGGNFIEISKSTRYNNLRIVIRGNNNVVKIGENCLFLGYTCIYIEGDNNSVTIGKNLIAQPNLSLVLAEGTEIIIQNDCLFARDVKIRTSDQHGIYDFCNERINLPQMVSIGNHVWIGAGSVVNKGAIIGNESVIGMCSLVTKRIPDNCVAAGVPAKGIKTNINWSREIK